MPTGSLLGAPFFAPVQPTHEEGNDRRRSRGTLQVRSGQFYGPTQCFLRGLQPASARVRLLTSMALPGERECRTKEYEKEVLMKGSTPDQRISSGEISLLEWVGTALLTALLLAMVFAILSASGALLEPLFGQAADVTNYLHEFAHDGRHLLSVPCH